MESLVNDLAALTSSNASLLFKKASLNTTCQNHRKLFSLKKVARKNLRLCHNVKRKKLTLRRSSHANFFRSENVLAKTKTNSNPHFTLGNTDNLPCRKDGALISNRKCCSHSHNHKHKLLEHQQQNSHHNHRHHNHHHHHHHHHRHSHSHKNRHQHHKSNHRHRHNSSIRSSSLNKHKHIMTLLIAARASIEAKTKKSMKIAMDKGNVSSASSSTTCLSNASSDSFKNLIRFKHTLKDRRKIGLREGNYLESTETLCGTQHQAANMIECSNTNDLNGVSRFPRNKKKTLNLYRVQKTYRYRNYRLHCVRLRRLEKKSKKKQLMLRSRLQNNFTQLLNKTHGNRLTSVSTATSTSSTGTSSSSSSSSTENFDLQESSCNTGCLCSSEEFGNDLKRNRNANKMSESRSTSSSTSNSSDNETSSSGSGRSRSSSRGSSHLSFSTSKFKCFFSPR